MSANLCLACSSSLPPQRSSSSSSTPIIYTTPCCSRPICPSCIALNPRLARYDPCLSCLGGVDVIRATRRSNGKLYSVPKNLDGSLKDEDTFVLGDDEDDTEVEESNIENTVPPDPPPSYSYTGTPQDTSIAQDKGHSLANGPPVYDIKKNDTLQGIALRFGVSGRQLCQINSLPPSTLTTTPHLLHTRRTIILPKSCIASALSKRSESTTKKDAERERSCKIEKAEKKLQILTKEADWHIAKAYVAISDLNDTDYLAKRKESGQAFNGVGGSSLERAAVEQYFEDEEWEEAERKAGRGVTFRRFPDNKYEA